MISPNAEPLFNVSPYKRIEIGAREWPKVVEVEPVVDSAPYGWGPIWGAVVEAMQAKADVDDPLPF